MNYDERLIGPKPAEEFWTRSRVRLDEMFQRRFGELQERRCATKSIAVATNEVIRDLAQDDSRLAGAVKEARDASKSRVKHQPKHPHRAEVQPRQRLGSVAVTFVPPFAPWQWTATTGGASATANVDKNTGTMGFDSWTGDNGKTASAAVALGCSFQPLADNGIMDVTANPGYSYDWETWEVLDSAHAGDFIGLYVGEYTLRGEFVQAVVDQKISMSDYESAGQPLFARTPVDSDHFYELWVWAGGDAEADGWSTFWGSAALSDGSVTVPSISVYAY